ncbi:hydrolase [Trichoderma arundinaceum]|uniref:Hydrolase n=1 Tax=Trichoderma arundinaceum TaxID=490622 RepID=A0A395NX96_TRIAR|nr:hydrolase [Trichoderma arundinaceum]
MSQNLICFMFLVSFALFSSITADQAAFNDWDHGRVQVNDVGIHFRYAGNGPPLLLIHGNPQHSYTWHIIGPILTSRFTVIAPDNRGAGDSSIPRNNDYSSEAMASDLKGLLDFLHIDQTLVFSHDKGVGAATALAAQYPNSVLSLAVSEYILPGFGYEEVSCPSSSWDLYSNWQLAFFSVTDAAEFFIRGREKEMLAWYFFHSSYSGNEAIPDHVLQRYSTSISKPGFLRSMLGPFSSASTAADRKFFTNMFKNSTLQMPLLVLGGEASLAPESTLKQFWGDIKHDATFDIVPKAGHWIADENPKWVAERLMKYFNSTTDTMRPANLTWLKDKITLV